MNSPAQQQQENVKEPSMEAQLSAEFDRLEAEGVEQADESVIDGELVEEVVEGEEVAEVEVSEEVHEEAVEEVEAQGEEAPVAEAEPDYDEPAPERWPDEIKEIYGNLPPVAKKAMLEGVFKPMQRTYTQSTQELARMKGAVQPMLEAMEQHRNQFERMGVDPADAFRRQIAWAAHLATVGPEQGLRDMQAAYGQNVQPAGQQQEEYMTPVERAMSAKIDSLTQQVTGTQQSFDQRQQQEQQNAQQQWGNQVQNGLRQFASEQKDGKLLHPHIEKAAPAMAGIIRGGLVTQTDEYGQPVPILARIAQAYTMACDMDPSIRSAAPRGGQVAKAIAAQNVGIATTTPLTTDPVDSIPLGQSIENLYDKMNAGGR
jgi:hypothetical protein